MIAYLVFTTENEMTKHLFIWSKMWKVFGLHCGIISSNTCIIEIRWMLPFIFMNQMLIEVLYLTESYNIDLQTHAQLYGVTKDVKIME